MIASKNTGEFGKANLDRMKRGNAPQDYNPKTGQYESRELHHVDPQRPLQTYRNLKIIEMNTIKQYLESEISDEKFFEELYKNQELQNILDAESSVPPYTNDGTLLFFLLSGNIKDMRFIINAKDALREFLQKKGFEFNFSNNESEIYNLIMDVQPKWLDVESRYFSDITKNYKKDNKKEIKELIKNKIKNDFIYIKNPPKWIQSPNWPIEDGEPLIFIGELDMGNILHDTSKIYVFYNKTKNVFKNIKQSY
jgi:hypothetical protein